ncbi:MAG: hypothetical protein KKF46_06800 [Nanoarchaeota archaeon]|nr:hypothetical protein [Nanoarchaeota archaeon]MBU1322038.1 hypothetical protein [Nanoarchaeota archaeon]MBU1597230.1 hypothetical protein [Nanoarchaeota archaeon]MBU2440725.1 hypothetical protein [Nanoarchaeota archaeon]
MKKCNIQKIYATPEQIIQYNVSRQIILGVNYEEKNDTVYAPRAVSSIPLELRKKFLDEEYNKFIKVLERVPLNVRLPVELKGTNPNEVNRLNHKNLYESKLIIPFNYLTPEREGASDGKGWEMGFSYGTKLLILVCYRGGKINPPTQRLDFQLPIIIDNIEKDGKTLEEFLRNIKDFEIGTGVCSEHGDTLIGTHDLQEYTCLKGFAEKYFELVKTKDFS